MAVVTVLHEVGVLGALVDRVVVLREGRVIHDGAPGVLGGARLAAGHHDDGDSGQRSPSWLDDGVGDGPLP